MSGKEMTDEDCGKMVNAAALSIIEFCEVLSTTMTKSSEFKPEDINFMITQALLAVGTSMYWQDGHSLPELLEQIQDSWEVNELDQAERTH